MIWNYIISAWRNLKKQKLFSLLNLIGLAIGMTAFLVFSYSAISKLHAERFHKDAERLFLLVRKNISLSNDESHSSFFPARIKDALELDFLEIEYSLRMYAASTQILRYNDRYFSESGGLFVDPEFFNILTYKLKSGAPESALHDPHSIVISAGMAEKYFGKDDPTGKIISLNNRENLVVIGVLDDLPTTSSLRFRYLIHFAMAKNVDPSINEIEQNSCVYIIKVRKNTDILSMNRRFAKFIDKHWPDNDQRPEQVSLFPLVRFRLGGRHIRSILNTSHPIMFVVSFGIGIILLLVVSFNFVNLALARNFKRNKEVAVRKTLGASRRQLIFQFIGESMLLSFLALGLAIILYEFVQPFLTNYMASVNPVSSARISRSIRDIPQMIYYLIGLALMTGLFSGIYPALVLSRFEPVKIFRGKTISKRKKNRGTKLLIVFQFILSLLFIIFARVSDFQFEKFLSADFGYDRSNVGVLPIISTNTEERERLETVLRQNAHVKFVSSSNNIPGMWTDERAVFITNNPEEKFTLDAFGIDYNFIEMLNMKILQGRSFNEQFSDENHFIINESALKKLHLENAIGTPLTIGKKEGVIIGVARDFLFGDIGFEIPPAILFIEEDNLNYLLFKYDNNSQYNSIKNEIQEKWLSIAPLAPFDCYTLEDNWQKFFGTMNKITGLFGMIGWLAILFSTLGLLGLSSYMVERRTKEIGIRKILGAATGTLIRSMTLEFVRAIIIANLITLPLIWFLWRKILQTGLLFFEPIPLSIYLFGILLSVGVATLAVYSQVWKAVRVNPAVTLKYE